MMGLSINMCNTFYWLSWKNENIVLIYCKVKTYMFVCLFVFFIMNFNLATCISINDTFLIQICMFLSCSKTLPVGCT